MLTLTGFAQLSIVGATAAIYGAGLPNPAVTPLLLLQAAQHSAALLSLAHKHDLVTNALHDVLEWMRPWLFSVDTSITRDFFDIDATENIQPDGTFVARHAHKTQTGEMEMRGTGGSHGRKLLLTLTDDEEKQMCEVHRGTRYEIHRVMVVSLFLAVCVTILISLVRLAVSLSLAERREKRVIKQVIQLVGDKRRQMLSTTSVSATLLYPKARDIKLVPHGSIDNLRPNPPELILRGEELEGPVPPPTYQGNIEVEIDHDVASAPQWLFFPRIELISTKCVFFPMSVVLGATMVSPCETWSVFGSFLLVLGPTGIVAFWWGYIRKALKRRYSGYNVGIPPDRLRLSQHFQPKGYWMDVQRPRLGTDMGHLSRWTMRFSPFFGDFVGRWPLFFPFEVIIEISSGVLLGTGVTQAAIVAASALLIKTLATLCVSPYTVPGRNTHAVVFTLMRLTAILTLALADLLDMDQSVTSDIVSFCIFVDLFLNSLIALCGVIVIIRAFYFKAQRSHQRNVASLTQLKLADNEQRVAAHQKHLDASRRPQKTSRVSATLEMRQATDSFDVSRIDDDWSESAPGSVDLLPVWMLVGRDSPHLPRMTARLSGSPPIDTPPEPKGPSPPPFRTPTSSRRRRRPKPRQLREVGGERPSQVLANKLTSPELFVSPPPPMPAIIATHSPSPDKQPSVGPPRAEMVAPSQRPFVSFAPQRTTKRPYSSAKDLFGDDDDDDVL